jgi:feruloyl-CoA synthase
MGGTATSGPDGDSAGHAALFAPPDIEVERRADGSLVLRSRTPLEPALRSMGAVLERTAREHPATTFLAERAPDGAWRRLTYADAWRTARAIGQALLDRSLGPGRPVVALSGNGIDYALLMLGCFVGGVPFAPVSPAYSLVSTDHAKLRHIAGLVQPGLVYVDDVAPFAPALAHAGFDGAEIVASKPGAGATPFGDLLVTGPASGVEAAAAAVGPDDIAKILFTSGSTGRPKGVITTHGMLCINQQMLQQVWPFLRDEPPVLVDWLPWSHTFGGSNNIGLVMMSGGTLYIDGGKPLPGLIDVTIQNLREISPTVYFNVPRGFALLVPYLERDEELAATFFARLRLILYAAAALTPEMWQRLEALGVRTTGRPVPMTAAWGSTETAPMATMAHFPLDGPGNIGVPVPGVEIKMVPCGAKLELRVRGPNVMPGYLGDAETTAAAFDEEGFYRIGDAGRPVDADDPSAGIVFDGRIAEDFKLSTGSWVSVATVRVGVISEAAPLMADAVVAGPDRDDVGLLAWIDLAAAERLFGCAGPLSAVVAHEGVRKHVVDAVARYNEGNMATTHRVARVLLLDEPPSIDANEVTDKGYINQRAALEHRAALVERLYAPEGDAAVLIVP